MTYDTQFLHGVHGAFEDEYQESDLDFSKGIFPKLTNFFSGSVSDLHLLPQATLLNAGPM